LLKTLPLLLLFLIAGCTTGISQTRGTVITGKAIKIIDGDTFDLLTDDNRNIRVRLFGIDCPERGQPFYKVCKNALADRCNGQPLKIIKRDQDRYKRMVADVYTVTDNQWINEQMVACGFAWHFTRYSNNSILAAAGQQAKAAKLGLWKDPSPVAPWEWRQQKRVQHP
jgi:micrococcal nuclease